MPKRKATLNQMQEILKNDKLQLQINNAHSGRNQHSS